MSAGVGGPLQGDELESAQYIDIISLDQLESGKNLLQSAFWGRFKSLSGWRPRGFAWKSGDMAGSLLVLERTLPGGQSLAYVPHGPFLPSDMDNRQVTSLITGLAEGLAEHLYSSCFMIRFDLTGGTSGSVGADTPRPTGLMGPLCKASYRIQPEDTVILPLIKNEETLLSNMHKKTRYNIRLAERKGLSIHRLEKKEALDALPKWYDLYRETGRRDGITLHDELYYKRLFLETQKVETDDFKLSLYLAYHEGNLLAGIIVFRCYQRSTYMYGASSSNKRELMPNHLLQWHAIRDAANEGADEYDFYGIPPSASPSHPMHGLWRFKTGFGGNIHHYYGAWDYPYKPGIYRIYTIAERFRGHLAAWRKRLAFLSLP